MTDNYGPYVRLWGVATSQFPPQSAHGDTLKPLLTSILNEALPFIQDVPAQGSESAASSQWTPKDEKTFSTSAAPVHLFERVVPAASLRVVAKEHSSELPHVDASKAASSESWFLRRSVHEDAAKAGTASWDEFFSGFKKHHAEVEKDFTPAVQSTQLRQQWDCSGIEIDIKGNVWVDWSLKYEESIHKLPAPLNKRRFPVLQVTASTKGRREFIVVQIAVTSGEESALTPKGLVKGAYTSVERIRETADGIEWVMGTASDAKGFLPSWMQNIAVLGLVAKDVSMFLEWKAKNRVEST